MWRYTDAFHILNTNNLLAQGNIFTPPHITWRITTRDILIITYNWLALTSYIKDWARITSGENVKRICDIIAKHQEKRGNLEDLGINGWSFREI
jgi:hypothetical protein